MTGPGRPAALADNQATSRHPSPISIQAAALAPSALPAPETPPAPDDPCAGAPVTADARFCVASACPSLRGVSIPGTMYPRPRRLKSAAMATGYDDPLIPASTSPDPNGWTRKNRVHRVQSGLKPLPFNGLGLDSRWTRVSRSPRTRNGTEPGRALPGPANLPSIQGKAGPGIQGARAGMRDFFGGARMRVLSASAPTPSAGLASACGPEGPVIPSRRSTEPRAGRPLGSRQPHGGPLVLRPVPHHRSCLRRHPRAGYRHRKVAGENPARSPPGAATGRPQALITPASADDTRSGHHGQACQTMPAQSVSCPRPSQP